MTQTIAIGTYTDTDSAALAGELGARILRVETAVTALLARLF